MGTTYMGDKAIAARIGDVIMSPGNVRGIVINVEGEFVKVLAIITDKTGDTLVLQPPSTHDFLASECYYTEKQTLNR